MRSHTSKKLVTTFQAILPFVRWSKVEKRLASRKGGSYVVDAVTPNESDFVTEAIAAITGNGSEMGN